MNKPEITIVVPIFNAEQYIERCIQSVKSQSLKNWELILVDDGSNDKTRDICIQYERIDNRIKYIFQDNAGAMSARKKGIEYANSNRITFIDADDAIGNEYLSVLLNNTNADCVVAGCTWIKNDGHSEQLKGEIEPKFYNEKEQIKYIHRNMLIYGEKYYKYGILPYMCTKLFKTDLARKVINEVSLNIIYGDDQAFVWKYLLLCDSILIIENYDYLYYQREDSLTNKKNKYYLRDLGELYVSLYEVFKANDNSKYLLRQLEMYIWSRLSWISQMMPWENPDIMLDMCVPNNLDLSGKRIVIYGAGHIGKLLYRKLNADDRCDVVGWLDINYEQYQTIGLMVNSPKIITKLEYDYVLVGVGISKKDEVISWLLEQNINMRKIVWAPWKCIKALP